MKQAPSHELVRRMHERLEARFRELKLRANPDCAYCAPGRDFPGYVEYEHFCGV